jgi:hypothetical protein
MTDQVEMEFLNNRQTVISTALAKLTAPAIQPFVPAYLSDSKTAAGIERSIKQIKKRVESMKQRFARLVKDPSTNDPVFKSVKRIIKDAAFNLKVADAEKQKQIHDLALQRFQRGFPPRKKQDHSIGDAINWEWILDRAKALSSDVLIVSRDGDFGLSIDKAYFLNDFLFQEFKDKVSPKKKVELSMSLTHILKKLEVKVTAAEEKEEENIIQQIPPPKQVLEMDVEDVFKDLPEFWPRFKERVKKSSPFTHTFLSTVACATFSNNTFVIKYGPEHDDYRNLIDNNRNRVMFQGILKELGLGDTVNIVFTSSVLQEVPNPLAATIPTQEEDDVPF